MPAVSARYRSLEHATAAAILLSAGLVAVWLLNDRALSPSEKAALMAAPSPRVAQAVSNRPQPAPVPTPSPSSQAAEILAIELIDLPAEPPPALAPAPQPAPLPTQPTPKSVQPVVQATPPPENADVAEDPPKPVEALSEPMVASPQPDLKPATPVIPLQPEREIAVRAPRVAPLVPVVAKPQPQATPSNPLRPSEERRVPVDATPLRPSPPKPQPQQAIAVPQPAIAPPKPVPIQTPRPTPARAAAALPIATDVAAVVGEGRAFLRILEQGAGPSIEIEWPSESRERDKLYDVLVRCLGMRTVIIDKENRLYVGEGPRGEATPLDADRYSGFVRRPAGAIASGEQREIARVRTYHQTLSASSPARIFPRRVDAYLIGGLHQAIGDGYMKLKSIHAAYRLSGGRAIVDSIVADGRPIAGVIDLSTVATACRS